MRKRKYSLLGLIREATEPDQKHVGKGKGLAVMVDGSKASDNSGALKAVSDKGGENLLKHALKTLGTGYSGEYYVWTKAGDAPTVKPLGKFYKKGSGDPYTYNFLGETDDGKRRYRVISGPVNSGTYKSGKFKGQKIGTRPIGAIFTMGEELDPVPTPDPTPEVAESTDLRIIDLLEKFVDFVEAFNAEIKPRSGTLSAAIPAAFKYFNKFKSNARSVEELEDFIEQAKEFQAMENANEDKDKFRDFMYDVIMSDAMKQYAHTAKEAQAPIPDIAGSDLQSKAKIAQGAWAGLKKSFGKYNGNPTAAYTVDKSKSQSQRISESFSRGELYRRRYWGRY